MSGLVKVEELVDYMSEIGLNAQQKRAARVVLDGIEGEVRRFLNRPILPVTVTETPEVDQVRGVLLVSQTPVRELVTPAPADGTVELRDGLLYDVAWLGSGPVTYVAGLADDDVATVKLQILRIAAREMQNKHDDTQGNSGIGSGEDAPMQAEGMQDEDRAKLRGLRKRVFVT